MMACFQWYLDHPSPHQLKRIFKEICQGSAHEPETIFCLQTPKLNRMSNNLVNEAINEQMDLKLKLIIKIRELSIL